MKERYEKHPVRTFFSTQDGKWATQLKNGLTVVLPERMDTPIEEWTSKEYLAAVLPILEDPYTHFEPMEQYQDNRVQFKIEDDWYGWGKHYQNDSGNQCFILYGDAH